MLNLFVTTAGIRLRAARRGRRPAGTGAAVSHSAGASTAG
jgi:hypothetical protein